MNGRERWDFLDKFDANLLYQYAEGASVKYHTTYFNSANDMYYLIWFVFRHVLNCKSYEEALKYAQVQTFQKYGIIKSLYYEEEEQKKNLLTIGDKEFGVININVYTSSLFKKEKSSKKSKTQKTIEFILDVLYHRYNYLEELECYIKHFGKADKVPSKQPVPVIEAKEILKKSITYMKRCPKYEGLLKQHQKTRKEILGDCYYEIK